MNASVRLSEVVERPVDWLADGLIPWGALTQVVGRGGQGKTTFAACIAARLTRGEPICPGMTPPAPSNVLVVSSEDSIEHVLRPRMRIAGANLEMVHAWNLSSRDLVLPDGIADLEREIAATQARLVIFDPLAGFVSARTDTHRDASLRGLLRPLYALAERQRLAILGILHVNQAAGGDVAVRVSGSGAWVNAARSAIVFGPPPDADESDSRRVAALAKSNYAPLGTAYEFVLRVPEGEEHPTLVYVAKSDLKATDVLSGPGDEDERSRATECVEWLAVELDRGPRPKKDITRAAAAANFTAKNLRTARERLKVESRREGFGPGSGAVWALPEPTAHSCPRPPERTGLENRRARVDIPGAARRMASPTAAAEHIRALPLTQGAYGQHPDARDATTRKCLKCDGPLFGAGSVCGPCRDVGVGSHGESAARKPPGVAARSDNRSENEGVA